MNSNILLSCPGEQYLLVWVRGIVGFAIEMSSATQKMYDG